MNQKTRERVAIIVCEGILLLVLVACSILLGLWVYWLEGLGHIHTPLHQRMFAVGFAGIFFIHELVMVVLNPAYRKKKETTYADSSDAPEEDSKTFPKHPQDRGR